MVATAASDLRLVVTQEAMDPSVRFAVERMGPSQDGTDLLWSGYRSSVAAAMLAAEEAARLIAHR
ncbi:hypothetical protein [Muricoccus radiodurans]|uniref:hypothetical protein n=1 Tax=Muricoccus radiodurans TaxID=2231721 RepID=UPI003CF2D584